jgi:CDGSH-type Zn-finger protein
MQFHCKSAFFNALPFSTQLCRCDSLLIHALPLLIKATPCIHSRCCSLLFHALPCLCKSPQFVAFPLRCISRQFHSHAIISNSELCRCGANHVGSMQFHCSSEPCFAIPLQILSNQRIAVAAQVASSPSIALAFLSQSSLCRCHSTPSAAQPYPAIAVN